MTTSRRIDGTVDEASREKLLLERLQILVERLRWTYAALWTLNPRSRVLQWKRGHFSLQPVEARKASSQPNPVTWYAQQFYTTYRSCSFTPGIGYVGRANLEGRCFWLSGGSVCQNAATLEQSHFLTYANIKTVMCIPWLDTVDSVLELGTTDSVGENFQLMNHIQQVMAHDLLSLPPLHEGDENVNNVAGFATRLDKTSTSAAATALQLQAIHDSIADPLPLPHQVPATSGRFQSAFDINLSDQVWRSDMDFDMQEQDNLPALPEAWRSTGHGLMGSEQSADHFKSRAKSFAGSAHDVATTTSSSASLSSHGDHQHSNSFSARPAATSMSPELLHQNLMQCLSPPISLSTAPDRTFSTVRLPQDQLHLQDAANYMMKHHDLHATGASNVQNNTLRRTSSCSDQYVQKVLSLLEVQEVQGHDRWPQQKLNPLVELADIKMDTNSLHTWHPGSSTQPNLMSLLAKQEFEFRRDGQLQRRHTLPAMDVLKVVDTYQQEAAKFSMVHNISSEPAAPGPSRVRVLENTRYWKGPPRATSSNSKVAAAHEEASVQHMLAERRRRVKQKENFATLRKMVPIISKADKASTLIDAIVYLKKLQSTVEEMEGKKADMVQRCKDLTSKCMKLEEQNKELEAILLEDKPLSDGVVQSNHSKLHSVKSI